MNPPFPILFVGDPNRQEFHEAATWLQTRGARTAPDISAALQSMNEQGFSPAVIVLTQLDSQPPAVNQLEQLRRSAPLARIVRLTGPWLLGESRSGLPLPATLRSQWHQWREGVQRPAEHATCNEVSQGSSVAAPWSLPLTASHDDRLLHALTPPAADRSPKQPEYPKDVKPTPLIAVYAQHRESAQSLCDICTQRNWKTLWIKTPPSETPLAVDAIIFDSAFGSTKELQKLAELKAITGAAPLIALIGFPRPEDISRLQSAGAAAVISKPFLADDLLWHIEQLLAAKT
jgi:CheY-like chemotaxis protein